MGVIEAPKQFSLPTTTLAQVDLCISIVQGIGNVGNPQAVRDVLIDLVSYSRIQIERLTSTRREMQTNGLFCPICFEAQFITQGGDCCSNGHGGCTGITEGEAKKAQDESKKCCTCGSTVETANGASHASCPKCGLVDTSDIESAMEPPKSAPPKNDVLSAEDLAAILEPESKPTIDLHTEVPLSSIKVDPPTPAAKEAFSRAIQTPKPKKAEEPKKAPTPAPKPAPEPPTSQVMPSSSAVTDEEAELVTSVIDDFLDEISRAGVATSA
jgi:hypothetical protein